MRSFNSKIQTFLVVTRVNLSCKNLNFHQKQRPKMRSNLTFFLNAIFTNCCRAYTGARFLQSHATKKEGHILIVFGCLGTFFLLFQDVIFMFFMISHNPSFYLNKTMFSRLHPLYYSTPRRLKSGKMASIDAFWSSRARVVYILQEDLNGFCILSVI